MSGTSAEAQVIGGGMSGQAPTGPLIFQRPTAGAETPGMDVPLGGSNEPAIAISPVDPQTIVIASLWEARISHNGGSVWGSSIFTPLPSTHFCEGDSSLAFDSQGRLFWTYLGGRFDNGNIDIFVSQLNPATGAVLPGYPVNITEMAGLGAGSGFFNDKEWLSADSSSTSPFVDNLYVSWTEFVTSFQPVFTSVSSNHGLTWSAAVKVSSAGEGFTWPVHNAVAPNGDVYVAYHSQTAFNGQGELGGNPTGSSGKIYVARSINGGVSFNQKTLAYQPGRADLTFNVQSSPGTIPNTSFWLQGSTQPWVLPDPNIPGAVYVVANDDPDNAHGAGDDADVFIVRSFSDGVGWSTPTKINSGPSGLFEVMPTAAIDQQTGDILVSWYSNAALAMNPSGNFLLDLFFTVSQDQGATFSTAAQVNDTPFDPDFGAPQRLPGPPQTLRIGEYMGVAIDNDELHFIWTGNTGNGQQVITDTLNVGPPPPPCLDLNNDSTINGADLAILLINWGQPGMGDFNNDGVVNGVDLATLLTNWGPCA